MMNGCGRPTKRASVAVTVGRGECSATAATMVSFDGLADDGEHIALVVPPVSPVPFGAHAQRVPHG